MLQKKHKSVLFDKIAFLLLVEIWHDFGNIVAILKLKDLFQTCYNTYVQDCSHNN